MLPWEVADLDNDVFHFWQGVISTYHSERHASEQRLQRRRR